MRDVTLLFLLREGEILLAMKKRGFGAGKWNAPGGKADPGETPEQAAIRECQEEICVTPANIEKVGELGFFMPHDASFPGHRAHIFTATSWKGQPAETEEMRPQWFKTDDIPYSDMWSDDILWLPLILNGEPFKGSITLGSNDEILRQDIRQHTFDNTL
jgi:mutator protein MutT